MNSAPEIIELTPNTWNLVAESVTSGTVWNLSGGKVYQTWRLTGGDTPDETVEDGELTPTEAVPVFIEHKQFESISASAAIDVYFWCTSAVTIRLDY